MAFCTNRNNVKPMFLGITFVVMAVLCLCATRAFRLAGTGHFTDPDGFTQSTMGRSLFGVFGVVTEHIPIMGNFAFSALVVAFISSLSFCALLVSLMASFIFLCLLISPTIEFVAVFAPAGIAILRGTSFVKLRNGFNLFASSAGFCYDWFSHLVLSLKKNYLVRAGQGLQSLFGSLHYCHIHGHVKHKTQIT